MSVKQSRAALKAMELLGEAGFEAWAVGGCIRDGLLGRPCHDVDITTSALPDQISAVFSGYRQVMAGLAHGTVTVLVNGEPLEITTFRRDGDYGDHRRPDSVSFTAQVEEDLARRDFTVNAMAWNPKLGLCDPFGGREDLNRGRLRCVGDGRKRFSEDGLRILRGLRFSAVYGFVIEEATERAMWLEQQWLDFVSAERIWVELRKTLASDGAAESLRRYNALWRRALPALPETTEETLRSMKRLDVAECGENRGEDQGADRDEELTLLRLALLLNGDEGRSRRLAEQAKLSRREAAVLTESARLWNHPICEEEGQLKRWIYRDGYNTVLRTLTLRQARSGAAEGADAVGGPLPQGCGEQRRLVERWRADGICVTLDRLSVNGSDLRNCGVAPGRQLGILLERALFAVMDGRVENEREALLRFLGL